jgi:A/G-specific adenine glycosylase
MTAPSRTTRAAWAPTLLDWYRRTRRDLPWRATRDPYRIWVS